MLKTLKEYHEDVSPTYYDQGIKKNFFQKIWHKKRFIELQKFIQKPKGKLLDIGCHGGLFTSQIIKNSNGVAIYGIDISKDAIVFAKKRIKRGHFYQADAHSLPFKNEFFDGVFCLEMLEHVENPQQVVKEMYRVLKKNKFGVVLIPLENTLFHFIWFLWNMYSPVWKHTHIQSFTEGKIQRLLEKEKFTVTRMKKTHLNMLLFIEFKK